MSFNFSNIFYILGLLSSLGILIKFILQKPKNLSIHLYTVLLPSLFFIIGTIIYTIEDPDPTDIQKKFVLSVLSSLITIAVSSIFAQLKTTLFPPK